MWSWNTCVRRQPRTLSELGEPVLPGRFHTFPWREEESLTTGLRILRPTVDVQLSLGESRITTKALIDTGAPRTVFPSGVADVLGIELPETGTVEIDLMGRRWGAITVGVSLLLRPFDDLGWEADVDFVLDEGLNFGLLGYEGFLNRWAVSFNAYRGYLVVEPTEDFHARMPIDQFEEVQRRWPDSYQP